MKKKSNIHSDITKKYGNNCREVLNLTLRDIGRKDPEAAKILYILALLGINFEKESLKELFGDEVEKKELLK